MADSEEASEENVASEEPKAMEDLATLLDVSQEVIMALLSSDEYRVVVEKVVDLINANHIELEEYSSTLRQLSDNLDLSDVQISTFHLLVRF